MTLLSHIQITVYTPTGIEHHKVPASLNTPLKVLDAELMELLTMLSQSKCI